MRSQDKRILQKIDNIYLDANYENKRICNYVDDYKTELGTYATKERALEVLDEIQNIFSLTIKDSSYQEADLLLKTKMLDIVYQMPEE